MTPATLIVGGVRSGKSAVALRLAAGLPGPRLYVATLRPPFDEETARRVAAHRAQRAAGEWLVAEEPEDLAGAARRHPGAVVLVDSLTTWVANLLDGPAQQDTWPAFVADALADLAAASRALFLVSDEVGLGGIAPHPVARRFADALGLCNQVAASQCPTAVHVLCGIPHVIKGVLP